MNIFFFTSAFPSQNSDNNLYSDLAEELASRGHSIYVFRPDESRSIGMATSQIRKGITVISIPTGRMQKTNALQKMVNSIQFEHRLTTAALSQLGKATLDLVIYTTPPIHVATAVKRVKDIANCQAYLLLKDIFPANAADLGMISRNGLLWNYFRRKESQLYQVADKIGCMSPANIQYLKKHNSWIPEDKIELCPNCILPTPIEQIPCTDHDLLNYYNIPKVDLNLIYGGNLGLPQGIDFLQDILIATRLDPGIHITIVGNGTEFSKLADFKKATGHTFALIDRLPKQSFQSLLASMDVGLIFLDRRFSIPNFPSRLLDYLDLGLPILAATDVNTDLGTFLHNEGCGLWCEAGDTQSFLGHLQTLKNTTLRKEMCFKSRASLDANFTVQRGANIILSHMERI